MELTALWTFLGEWWKTDTKKSLTDRLQETTLGETMFRAPTEAEMANTNNYHRFHLVVHISTIKAFRQNFKISKYQELRLQAQTLFDTIKNMKEKIAEFNGLVIVNENHKCIEFYWILLNEKNCYYYYSSFVSHNNVFTEGKSGKEHWYCEFT